MAVKQAITLSFVVVFAKVNKETGRAKRKSD
jgi:hypothetical protein